MLALDPKIGLTIKSLRKANKLSQTDLGQLAGTGINFVSQLENAKATVRLDKLLAVLKVLGLELHLQRGKAGISIDKELAE